MCVGQPSYTAPMSKGPASLHTPHGYPPTMWIGNNISTRVIIILTIIKYLVIMQVTTSNWGCLHLTWSWMKAWVPSVKVAIGEKNRASLWHCDAWNISLEWNALFASIFKHSYVNLNYLYSHYWKRCINIL